MPHSSFPVTASPRDLEILNSVSELASSGCGLSYVGFDEVVWMLNRNMIAMLALAVLVAGCASTRAPQSRIDYDRNVDFSVYRTYGFPKETGTDRGGYSTLVTSYFKNAISTAMEARGYKYAEENPDLLVNFFMNTRERTEVRPNVGAGYGYYGYREGLYGGWPLYDR